MTNSRMQQKPHRHRRRPHPRRRHKDTILGLTLQAAVLGLHHEPSIHYTQGGARWEGIHSNKHSDKGQYPRYADCSAFVTWCYWNGLTRYRYPDIINGQHWQAGYTGTMLEHGWGVSYPRPGDAVIYGTSYPGEHVALYSGGGLVISHGSESGPMLLPWRYRPDILSIRRYF